MRRYIKWMLLLVLFQVKQPQVHATGDTIRILFVGNSLTYMNDLPSLVRELGSQEGKTIMYQSFLQPDYAIEDHLNEGNVERELAAVHYDFVVAQQGPSAMPESQRMLLEAAKRLADICAKVNTKLAFYMVWPAKARSFDLDNVIISYTNAAKATGALLCPAGLGWKYAWEADADLSLYGADNFHPSFAGSVLAALAVYGALTGKKDFNFINRKKCSWKNDITAADWQKLKKAAEKAISER